jgi:hypothetical protein
LLPFLLLFPFFSFVSWLGWNIKRMNLGLPVRFRTKCSSDNPLTKMLPKSRSSIFLSLIVCFLLRLFACIFFAISELRRATKLCCWICRSPVLFTGCSFVLICRDSYRWTN